MGQLETKVSVEHISNQDVPPRDVRSDSTTSLGSTGSTRTTTAAGGRHKNSVANISQTALSTNIQGKQFQQSRRQQSSTTHIGDTLDQPMNGRIGAMSTSSSSSTTKAHSAMNEASSLFFTHSSSAPDMHIKGTGPTNRHTNINDDETAFMTKIGDRWGDSQGTEEMQLAQPEYFVGAQFERLQSTDGSYW